MRNNVASRFALTAVFVVLVVALASAQGHGNPPTVAHATTTHLTPTQAAHLTSAYEAASATTTTTSTSPPEPPTTVSVSIPAPSPVAASVGDSGGSDATSVDTPDWACIRQHESGGSYAEHGGGAYQFENGTFTAITGLAGPAEDYPPAVQDAAALRLYAERGWEPWTTRWVCGLG